MSYKLMLNSSRNFVCRSTKYLRPIAVTKKFLDDFKDFYTDLVDKTMSNYKYHCIPQIESRYKKSLEYFTVCKMPTYGELLINAYELLEEPENLTGDKLHQVYTVACAIEAIQSCKILQNDYVNNVSTRAGKSAWHLLPGSSNMVINDMHVIRSFVNEMLLQNIKESIYTQIMDIFNEMYLEFEMGQFLDFTLRLSKGFDKYTIENYEQIARLATSCSVLNGSLRLSLILSDKATEDSMRLVKRISSDLGVMSSIKNDFLEYVAYSDGVSYNLYRSGTCTWPAVTALRRFNEVQKKMFKESYGSTDPVKAERVMKLYDDIDLKSLYKLEETNRFEAYLKKFQDLSPPVPSSDFLLKVFEIFQNCLRNTTNFRYELK